MVWLSYDWERHLFLKQDRLPKLIIRSMTQNKEILQNLKLRAYHLSEPLSNYQPSKEYKIKLLSLAVFSPKCLNLNLRFPKFSLWTSLLLVRPLILNQLVRNPPLTKGELTRTVMCLTTALQPSSRRTSRSLQVRFSSWQTPSRPSVAASRWSGAFSFRRSETRSTIWGWPATHGGLWIKATMRVVGLFRILLDWRIKRGVLKRRRKRRGKKRNKIGSGNTMLES